MLKAIIKNIFQSVTGKSSEDDVCLIVEDGRQTAYSAVNSTMLETWGNELWKKNKKVQNEKNTENI